MLITPTPLQHDTRGIPIYTCQCQSPAIVGACLWCEVTGWQLPGSSATAYTTAVVRLAGTDPARDAYCAAFGGKGEQKLDPRVGMGRLDRIKKKTHTVIKARQRQAEVLKAAGRSTKDTGFKGSDVLSDTLSYVDIPAQTVYCTPHGVWGAVKDLIKSMSGKAYGRNRRTNEKKFNPARAKFLDDNAVKVGDEARARVDFLVSTKMVQPGGRRHDAMRPPFEGISLSVFGISVYDSHSTFRDRHQTVQDT